MKKCSKCNIEKELSEFSKDKSRKDGLTSYCKACHNQYRLENSDKIKKYRLENSERLKLYRKNYNKNRGVIPQAWKEVRRNWIINNKDRYKQYQKKYRESLKDGLHHVYYLPDHNYVGTTDCLPHRMASHRSEHGRNTDNYQILASFEDRGKALRFESILHDSGFEGRHSRNSYQ